MQEVSGGCTSSGTPPGIGFNARVSSAAAYLPSRLIVATPTLYSEAMRSAAFGVSF
jgi:hypothetical protein